MSPFDPDVWSGRALQEVFVELAFSVALVIFFVPDPAKGVAEMVRVVSPGGTVAAYAWDMAGGGFPLQPVQTELLAMGFSPVCTENPIRVYRMIESAKLAR